MPEKEIGFVEHWFSNIMVAGIKMTNGSLKSGDKIHIKGHTTDFECTVGSIQMDHGAVDQAKKGDDIGIKVPEHAREHDKVFLVS